jgi:hypothetical protein
MLSGSAIISSPIDLFLNTPNPPKQKYLTTIRDSMISEGLLTSDLQMTRIGHFIAELGVQPWLGSLILDGIIFHCLESALGITALIEAETRLYNMGLDGDMIKVKASRTFDSGVKSDHLTELNILNIFASHHESGSVFAHQFCQTHNLNYQALKTAFFLKHQLKSKLVRILRDIFGLELNLNQYNSYSHEIHLLKALVAANLYPNVSLHRHKNAFRSKNHPWFLISGSSTIHKHAKIQETIEPQTEMCPEVNLETEEDIERYLAEVVEKKYSHKPQGTWERMLANIPNDLKEETARLVVFHDMINVQFGKIVLKSTALDTHTLLLLTGYPKWTTTFGKDTDSGLKFNGNGIFLLDHWLSVKLQNLSTGKTVDDFRTLVQKWHLYMRHHCLNLNVSRNRNLDESNQKLRDLLIALLGDPSKKETRLNNL